MKFLKEELNEKEYLYYDNLTIMTYGPLIDDDYYELPYNEWEEEETIEYEYEVDKQDVEQVIIDLVQEKENKYFDSDEEVDQWLKDNYDEYLEKYNKEILDHFKEEAKEKAESEYEY